MDQQVVSARCIVIDGRVQGVGYRPFVYRLAHSHSLRGWVRNSAGVVHVHAEGPGRSLDRFTAELVTKAPPSARPHLASSRTVPVEGCAQFLIQESAAGGQPGIHVAPDHYLCDDCLAEMREPTARRFRYPFINCTQCGPRYTIIRELPYDRPNTTMADFPLCAACLAEYLDPLDRRFHAQPLACPDCGPHLAFESDGRLVEGNEAALAAAVSALETGGIIAVRGIGGYHLLCDAANEAAVTRLRERKHRPHKPLALMAPLAGEDGLDWVRHIVRLDAEQAAHLTSPVRPIMLVPRRVRAPVASSIAPGLNELGIMLPYSPLHHLLVGDFGRPVVATSGNISGEPVLTDAGEAERRLGRIVDAFLDHDRPIQRPADDPVFRCVAGRMRPLRLGRGNAPVELELPFHLPRPILATGAFLKNTVALAWGNRVVVSPHVGNLGSPRGQRVFAEVAGDLQALYGVDAETVACDAHPDFPSTRWAKRSGLPLYPIHHHHAHAAAAMAECGVTESCLCFTWDGVGLGEDGTLWGGEALLGRPGRWRRVASLRPFRLPGGERAALEPWRSALGLCWAIGREWPEGEMRCDPRLYQAWQRGLNCPVTTAAGRLFDAAAALIGVATESSFEGQAPMMLEALCAEPGKPAAMPLVRDEDGLWRVDWAPLVDMLTDARRPPARRAEHFHASLANAVVAQAQAVRRAHGVSRVALAGGVFQNAVLTAEVRERLVAAGFAVHIPALLPVNDAAISYGQVVEAASRMMADTDRVGAGQAAAAT